jgi:salicylate hydroxylase
MHLHDGLAKAAMAAGAEIHVNSRVVEIDWTSSTKVTTTTSQGTQWTFDVLVGADGLKSIVRRKILPNAKPKPPTNNCAYRAIVPMEKIRKDPIARELVDKCQMNIWQSEGAYIITYPISNRNSFNMVWSHHRGQPIEDVEDVDMDEVRLLYRDFDPRLKRICDMAPTVRRWPLLVTGPLETWSNPQKNVVLIG